MWKAGLSISGTLLGLYATRASAQDGVMCDSKMHGGIANNDIETNVKSLAMEICETHLEIGSAEPFRSSAGPGGYALTITHSDQDPGYVAAEECVKHFGDIVECCILEAGVWGGMAQIDGLTYEILRDDDTSIEIEARAPKKGEKTGKDKGKDRNKKPKPTPTPTPTPDPSKGDACEFTPVKNGKGKKLAARCSGPPKARHNDFDHTEHYNTLSKSDLTSEFQSCPKKGKRSLEALAGTLMSKRAMTARSVASSVLKRQSGDRYAKTWDEWVPLLKQVDGEYSRLREAEKKANVKTTIIWAGGISAVRLGVRNTKKQAGKTGDIDFLYHVKTSEDERKLFKEAIVAVEGRNAAVLPPKSITVSLEQQTGGSVPPQRLNEWSRLSDGESAAFVGKNFEAKDGDMLFQIYGKMSRMYSMRQKRSTQEVSQKKQFGQHKIRDVQDAAFFFDLWTKKNGKLDMDDFMRIAPVWGKNHEDMEALVSNTMNIVTKSEKSLGPKIIALLKQFETECAQWTKQAEQEKKKEKEQKEAAKKGRPGA